MSGSKARRSSPLRLAGLAAILLAVPLGGCERLAKLGGIGGEPPFGILSVEPVSGQVPLRVWIDSSDSYDQDGRIERRELRMNDGPYTAVDELHALTIGEVGTHLLSLRLTDDSGNSSLVEARVVVEAGIARAPGFDIEVRHPSGPIGGREIRAFESAARRWSEVVVGELPDSVVRASQVEQACGAGYRFSGSIDDLLLFGDVREVDGPGSVVGMAGACLLRADGLPLVGLIILDRADTADLEATGNLDSVVLHELGHVLDMGLSGWQRRGLLEHDRPGCFDSRSVSFTGEQAAREFALMGGNGPVPVEDNGLVGTACSHWKEDTFRSELMTGYLDSGAPLSRLTAAALIDMGYLVDLSAADEFSLPTGGGLRVQERGLPLGERLLAPGGMLDDAGDFVPLPAAPATEPSLQPSARMAPPPQ